MKFEGVGFNPDIPLKMNKTKFKKRFVHLWPNLPAAKRNELLSQAYDLLKHANGK